MSSRLEAVVWDMDGVIIDTALYHFTAWQEAFGSRGVQFTEEQFKQGFGQRNDTIIHGVMGDSISTEELELISLQKEASFRDRIRQNLKPLPGALELMAAIRERGIKMALASSAPVENIQLILVRLGVANCFHTIVSAEDVTEGKPSPQGFLLAAQRLHVESANCLVIEDAIAGVAAAKRAGMRCLAVTNTHPRDRLKEADLVVDSLKEVSIPKLERLFP